MKVAHIILAHKNPFQVERMIKRLSHPDVDCWLHIDKQSDIAPFKSMFLLKNVHTVYPRVNAKWASYGIVQAMLNGINAAMLTGTKYQYFSFLSGQDYPLQTPEAFLDYLQEYEGYEFIGNRPCDETLENMIRVRRYYLNDYSLPGKSLAERVLNILLGPRKLPFEIRKGPQWMTITSGAAEYVLKVSQENPRYVRFFKFTHAPDEFFVQTILYHSPFRSKMMNGMFHHMDWSERKKSPKTFTIQDYRELEASTQFFARKFDTQLDSVILDKLDERLNARLLQKNQLDVIE